MNKLRLILLIFVIGFLWCVFSLVLAEANYPDATNTGWQHTGVTLSPYTGPTTITTSGTVIDSKQINSSITISANNVTIKRSQVNGQIFISGSSRTGVLVEDVKIIAGNISSDAAGQCIGGNSSSSGGATAAGFVIRRVDMSGCAQGVYGRGFTLEDSYIHDLYGTGDAHNEAILGHTGQIVIRHNHLHSAFNAQSNGGGMSAVIALYTHSSFWGDIDNVIVEQNYIKTANSGAGRAGYCFYGGNSPDNSGNATNTTYRDNVFARGSSNLCGQYGPIVYMPSGGNNCASGNRYEDGVAISFGLPACQTEVDTTAPTTPTNLTATAQSSTQINLTWTASTDAVGVTGYRVERCTGTSCANYTQVGTPTTNSYSDTGLSADTTYRYRVRATDAAGNFSGYSSVVSGTTSAGQIKSDPVWSVGRDSSGKLIVNSGILGNITFRSEVVNDYPSEGENPGCIPVDRVAYDWTVDGYEGRPFGSCLVAGVCPVYENNDLAHPSWKDQALRHVLVKNWNLKNAFKTNSEPHVDVVQTLDSPGWGGWFVMQDSNLKNSDDGIVQFQFGYQGNGGCSAYEGRNRSDFGGVILQNLVLNQEPGFVADCVARGTDDVCYQGNHMGSYNPGEGWLINYQTNGWGITLQQTWKKVVVVGTMPDISFRTGDSYAFATQQTCTTAPCSFGGKVFGPYPNIEAAIAAGHAEPPFVRLSCSGWADSTNCVNNSSDTTPPATPTNFSASAVSSSVIDLSWTASVDDWEMGGYQIERCLGSDCSNFTLIDTILDTTTYSDTGLTAETTYRYRIRAEDAVGNTSSYSSIQSATTPEAPPQPTFVGEYETAWNTATSPKTTNTFSVQVGDILVAYAVNENGFSTIATPPTGTLQGTWTLKQSGTTDSYTGLRLWTMSVASNQSNVNVSFSNGGNVFGGNVLHFRNASAVGVSGIASSASGNPTLTLNGVQGNSAIVMVNGDWTARTGARTYVTGSAGTFTETTYYADGSSYGVEAGYYANAGVGGNKTIGLTAPTGMKWTLTAIEIQGAPVSTTLTSDFNGDDTVNIFDYNILLTNFGATADCGNPADANGDCSVNIFDYNILLSEFGMSGE